MTLSRQTKDNLHAALIILAVIAVVVFTPPQQLRFVAGFISTGSAAVLMIVYTVCRQQAAQLDEYKSRSEIPASVDPWAMMNELMKISDQQRPQDPSLTKASLMYCALILEEGSETFRLGVVPALDRLIAGELERAKRSDTPAMCGQRIYSLRIIRGKLQETAHRMDIESKAIRQHLKEIPEFTFPLLRSEAVPVYDGTIDLAVVNCGFCIASGLDGAAGYLEVAGSNLSKKNPDSGVIDKTPDGKWIKGRHYREPDLARVLTETNNERGLQGLTACC